MSDPTHDEPDMATVLREHLLRLPADERAQVVDAIRELLEQSDGPDAAP